ncbi:Ribonuclease H domain [Forsythia ovata]|uniref:Ribonuclease H domain n=1 Tax=Forsythia ovata TaxID=205694 RepID=A0ABD1RMK0_9LAMI
MVSNLLRICGPLCDLSTLDSSSSGLSFCGWIRGSAAAGDSRNSLIGLKINTDASVRPDAGFYTTGAVIRDECGFFVAMQERKVIGQLSAEDTDVMAVGDGLILARDRGYQIAVTECDLLRAFVGHKCSNHEPTFFDFA